MELATIIDLIVTSSLVAILTIPIIVVGSAINKAFRRNPR